MKPCDPFPAHRETRAKQHEHDEREVRGARSVLRRRARASPISVARPETIPRPLEKPVHQQRRERGVEVGPVIADAERRHRRNEVARRDDARGQHRSYSDRIEAGVLVASYAAANDQSLAFGRVVGGPHVLVWRQECRRLVREGIPDRTLRASEPPIGAVVAAMIVERRDLGIGFCARHQEEPRRFCIDRAGLDASPIGGHERKSCRWNDRRGRANPRSDAPARIARDPTWALHEAAIAFGETPVFRISGFAGDADRGGVPKRKQSGAAEIPFSSSRRPESCCLWCMTFIALTNRRRMNPDQRTRRQWVSPCRSAHMHRNSSVDRFANLKRPRASRWRNDWSVSGHRSRVQASTAVTLAARRCRCGRCPARRPNVDCDCEFFRRRAQRVGLDPMALAFEPALHDELVEFEQLRDGPSSRDEVRHGCEQLGLGCEVAHRGNEFVRLTPALPLIPGNTTTQVLVDLAFREWCQIDLLERVATNHALRHRAGTGFCTRITTLLKPSHMPMICCMRRSRFSIARASSSNASRNATTSLLDGTASSLANACGSTERGHHDMQSFTGPPLFRLRLK